ncbi:hypothetical protein [Anabaena azotica]|uniref:Uncharacterized protein n=1 Tax=Anabaena azotica FACHB-119 TaxID=947527 RepID=A0ABR8D9R4_9NOST|nr:hypothetical protein [Anabaena azotica]MBD2503935.1 hypothetical protein [Anabaena azotica FACHB-119]
MTNPHIGGDALEYINKKNIPDTYETRFIEVLEYCRYALHEINQGRITDARNFLENAITQAERPWQQEEIDETQL